MAAEEDQVRKKEGSIGSVDLEKLLEQREYLDQLIQKKFQRLITIMFTDLKGSTSIAEKEGDVVSRLLIKRHNDIVFPIIANNKGVLVKTMGDGTLSYFEHVPDAVRAAVQIQRGLDDFNNRAGKTGPPILVRIGLNTGIGIVEKHDIFGDVVNAASRIETEAGPGEIYISESSFNALEGGDEFYCRFIKTTVLRNKAGTHRIFKVFWNAQEAEEDKARGAPSLEEQKKAPETAASPEDRESAAESESLRKAGELERDKELVTLYLLCEANAGTKAFDEISGRLQGNAEKYNRLETRFDGQDAVWFFRKAIVIGRIPEADLPLTNQAISRVPVRVGLKDGQGFLEIEGKGGGKLKPVEVEKENGRELVQPDREYPLGRRGRIIFSACFPVQYDVVQGRFLTLKIEDPRDCLKKEFNLELRDVWKDFEKESARIVIVGK
jgi:class 3 adenylate cyclase